MDLLSKTTSWPSGPGRWWSSYDWISAKYRVFHDPNAAADGGGGWNLRPKAAPTRPISSIGDPIENLLNEIPRTAKFVRWSDDPYGEIGVINRQQALWGMTNVPGRASGTGTAGLGGSDTETMKSLLPVVFIGGLAVLFLGGYLKVRNI